MIVHLVDGTYELFRHFYGLRRAKLKEDPPLGAVAGVLHTVLQMIEQGATHVGVATDHVIESFRNALWPGYKTGEGIDPALAAQFQPLEDALAAMGVVVWPMIELEADDALASAAHIASQQEIVEKVCIWANDKDLAACVRGDRVEQADRARWPRAPHRLARVRGTDGSPPPARTQPEGPGCVTGRPLEISRTRVSSCARAPAAIQLERTPAMRRTTDVRYTEDHHLPVVRWKGRRSGEPLYVDL